MIEEASVYDVAIDSPTTHAINLSLKENNNIYLKREDLQPIFSFKNLSLIHISETPRQEAIS